MSTYFLFLSDKGPTLETLDYIIRIGSTPTFSYFNIFMEESHMRILWKVTSMQVIFCSSGLYKR